MNASVLHRRKATPLIKIAGLIWGFLCFVCTLEAQKIDLWKGEVGRVMIGEYSLSYEKKIFGKNKIPTHNGYYEREMYLSGRTPKQARMTYAQKAFHFLFNDRKKFYTLSGGYSNRDFTARRELYDGIFGRFGVRRYFSEEPPTGFYVSVGVNYQMIFGRTYNEFYETLIQGTIHRPSVMIPVLGWQWTLGSKNTYAIDAQLGADWGYAYQVQPPPYYQFQSIPNIRVFWGLAIGVVRYKQRSIW